MLSKMWDLRMAETAVVWIGQPRVVSYSWFNVTFAVRLVDLIV